MDMTKSACWLLCVGALGGAWAAGAVEENLCDFRPDKVASWQPNGSRSKRTVHGVCVRTDAKRKEVHERLCSYWFPAYTASERIRISFRYRGDMPRADLLIDFTKPNEKQPDDIAKKLPYIVRPLTPKAEWQEFSIEVPWASRLDYWGTHILRLIARGDGGERFVELAEMGICELPPERPKGRALRLGGARATEIAILDGEEWTRHQDEYRAARMFRYMLYMNGGDYLPIRTAKSLGEIGTNAVLIGAAAEKAGLFTADELAQAKKTLTGACAYRVKDGRLGITGELPAGLTYGVFAFWRELGVEYLGAAKWRAPKAGDYAAADGFGRVRVPAIAYRCENYRNELGMMPELRGRCLSTRVHCTYAEGFPYPHWKEGTDHAMPGALISLDEFAKTHTDFFALQANGVRLTNEVPWRVQYCMSNPRLREVLAARILEMMRLHPEARIYGISPGDGGGNYCKCKTCASRPMSETWLELVNYVAERTEKEFPDNYVDMSIYVDTPEPPRNVKPRRNVVAHYCPYDLTWPSCMVIDDPVNRRGWEKIAAWRKIFPRLRIVYYPSQCGQNMNMWASFDSDNLIIGDFARHNAISSRYFGFAVPRGGDMPQTPGFADMRIYVIGRVEEDPSYDALAGAKAFIRDFYGAAAPEIAEYFEIFRTEAKRRRWIQNCEQNLPGFVTPELADRCLPILDRAEAKVRGDPANLPAVQHEKQNFLWTYLDGVNPGSGNVPKEDFAKWARRVADFIRICQDTHIGFISGKPIEDWFHDAAFVEVPKKGGACGWLETAEVQAILKDPVKGLGGEFPTLQKTVPGGYEIPARGFAGGQFSLSSWLRKKAVGERALRRPSMGNAYARTRLNLRKQPSKDVKLSILGIDNDHKPVAEMSLAVNGKVLYSGAVPWKKDAWTEAAYTIPAKLLHAGDNSIEFRNITGDGDIFDAGPSGDPWICSCNNPYWGWFAIEKLRFEVAD